MTQDASDQHTANAAVMTLQGGLSDRSRWSTDACPIAAALTVVGTRSAMLIIREAMYGTTRFDDFVGRVGVTEAVTAVRLRELTQAGLLSREPYREPGQRTRYQYRLTQMGVDLAPAVLALFDWGSAYLTADGRAPLDFAHRDCGARVRVETVCDDGHRVTLDEVTVRAARRP